MKAKLLLVIVGMISMFGGADAALIDRGGGLIYDTDRNITWLQNPNNNLMTVSQAHNWAINLSYYDSVRKQTLTGWRLPTVDEVGYGYNFTGSEMGHLFYTELGNKGFEAPDGSSPQPGWGLNNKGPFSNLQPYFYWTDTKFPDVQGFYYVFSFDTGVQDGAAANGTSFGGSGYHALAVRPGDVISHVPVPAAILLLLLEPGLY